MFLWYCGMCLSFKLLCKRQAFCGKILLKHFLNGFSFFTIQQLAFFPKTVWALRKSVYLPKRITFSWIANSRLMFSHLTLLPHPVSAHATSHQVVTHKSYQLPCHKSCHCEAYYVQYLLTTWDLFQGCCIGY